MRREALTAALHAPNARDDELGQRTLTRMASARLGKSTQDKSSPLQSQAKSSRPELRGGKVKGKFVASESESRLHRTLARVRALF